MKIRSRPSEDAVDVLIGSGSHTMCLTDEQLELIAALVCTCRLGQNGYSSAAFEIIDLLESAFGTDWIHDATDKVDPQVTVEDHRGNEVFKSVPGIHFTTMEV